MDDIKIKARMNLLNRAKNCNNKYEFKVIIAAIKKLALGDSNDFHKLSPREKIIIELASDKN